MEQPKNSRKWLKLILFGVGSLVVLLFVAGLVLYAQFGPALMAKQWSLQLHQAIEVTKTDSTAGKDAIDKVFSEARAGKAPIGAMMGLHRDYARYLYHEDEKREGDEQIQQAISLCSPDPPPNSLEADQLTHAYQDRGWDSHERYLKGTWKSSGDKDQEMSVAVADKAFGPEHEQTIYKVPTLALIYADLNQWDKAEKLMQRAIIAADTKDSAKECAWFVYALLARMRAVQHDYKAAVLAFMHGTDVSVNDNQRARVWSEFCIGLRQGKPSAYDMDTQTSKLIAKEKFKELDQLGDRLLATQEACADGFWKLDRLCSALDGGREFTEKQYRQRVLELNKWLKENPHSLTARVSLPSATSTTPGMPRWGPAMRLNSVREYN